MSKNTGIPFETFTQHIFNSIINQGEVKTIEIKQNITLQGKSTVHQIDVYWEFENGGIKYYTIVQAKDWNQPVDKGKLLQFKGVLDDLPNQPRGIFVTKKGYQKGAKEVAIANGIVLYELREATGQDKRDLANVIEIKLISYVPDANKFEIIPDRDWISEEKAKLNLGDKKFKFNFKGFDKDLIFIDQNNNVITNMHNIIDSYFKDGYKEIPPMEINHEFETDVFIKTDNPELSRLKIKGIKAVITVLKTEDIITIMGEDIVKYILRNVIDETDNLFDKDKDFLS